MTSGQLIWKTLVDAFTNGVELLTVNILWLLFTILIIPAPAAAAGLFYTTHVMASGRAVTWQHFFEGFRKYWKVGLVWLLTNLVVVALISGSFFFYASLAEEGYRWLQAATGLILVGWLFIQIYTFPLLLEQETPSLRVAMRNSIVFYIRMPGYSLGLALFISGIVYLSFLLRLPWVLVTASLCTFLSSRFTLYMLSVLTGRKLEI